MITQIASVETPAWLASVNASTISTNPFPLKEILTDSLYYPSSGFDGYPVRFLAGNFLSFIYVDYGRTESDLNNELKNYNFIGYETIARRSLTEKDLAPNGWTPIQPLPIDGNPLKYAHWIKKPFAEWMIFQRQPDFTSEHGPERFSLVYLCADGVAAFQALYISNKITPKAVAIIRPGTGFGANWTDYRDPEQIFARSVLQNPAGIPEYLLDGQGVGDSVACWSQYDTKIAMLGNKQIGVWKRRN